MRKEKKTKLVAFRLTSSECQLLSQEAGRYDLSPGEFARLLVCRELADPDSLDHLLQAFERMLRARVDSPSRA